MNEKFEAPRVSHNLREQTLRVSESAAGTQPRRGFRPGIAQDSSTRSSALV
jgi:hypothetical protein